MSIFDQLSEMVAAKRLADSRAATLLPYIPNDQGQLPPQQPAPQGGGFLDELQSMFGGGQQQPPSAVAPAMPAPTAAMAPVPAPPSFAFSPSAPAPSVQAPAPVAWDKSRQSGGVLSQLLGQGAPQSSAFAANPAGPLPNSGADHTTKPMAYAPDAPSPVDGVPLPRMRPA